MFPLALAKSGANWRSPLLPRTAKPRDGPFMEREGWKELCWQLFGSKGRKRKNFLLRLGGEGEGEERKGWGCCKNNQPLCHPVGLARPSPPRDAGHTSTRAGRWGGAAARLEAELKVSSRGGRKLQAASHPVSLPGERRFEQEGTENGRRARRDTRPRPSAGPLAAAPAGAPPDWVRKAQPPPTEGALRYPSPLTAVPAPHD